MKRSAENILASYIDALHPIIYINHFDFKVIDAAIAHVGQGAKCVEFNNALGLVDFKTKSPMKGCSLEEFLKLTMDDGFEQQEYLPEEPSEEIHKMTDEIVTTLHRNEAMHQSLQEAVANGRSRESWFAAQTQKSISAMSAQEASVYLAGLDKALDTANEQLYHTINTKAGVPSQNPNLDGYIAEQYHAQTFNLNAEATGSEYRAKVLEPDGAYGKNSVDVVIVDGEGKIVKRYQCKYGQDSHATGEMFEKGDYRGQGKLIPDGQEIEKKSSNVIEAPDGTTSKPLSKEKAKQMQEEAQSGNWSELNWNEYQVKDLAMGIGKQAGTAALQGAVIGAGMTVAQKVWNGEEIDGQEVVEAALTGGADFGVKAATAGALKVASEKEILSVIPKGTPAGTFANIAYVAVENVKVLGKVATGELTLREGLEKMQETTASTVAGLASMSKGAAIGGAVGLAFGPVGAAVGGFVGGTVAYMAGSKVGELAVKGARKVFEVGKTVVKKVAQKAADIGSRVLEHVGNLVSNFAGFLGF